MESFYFCGSKFFTLRARPTSPLFSNAWLIQAWVSGGHLRFAHGEITMMKNKIVNTQTRKLQCRDNPIAMCDILTENKILKSVGWESYDGNNVGGRWWLALLFWRRISRQRVFWIGSYSALKYKTGRYAPSQDFSSHFELKSCRKAFHPKPLNMEPKLSKSNKTK